MTVFTHDTIDQLTLIITDCTVADFSADGRWLLTQYTEETLLWDVRARVVKRKIQGEIHKGAFSHDGRYIVVYHPSSSEIQVIDVDTGTIADAFAAESRLSGDIPIGKSGIAVRTLRFHPQTLRLLTQVKPTLEWFEDMFSREL